MAQQTNTPAPARTAIAIPAFFLPLSALEDPFGFDGNWDIGGGGNDVNDGDRDGGGESGKGKSATGLDAGSC
ncbi:hypothetical protein SLA2020_422230 [Shorea laevis]